jgi:hypothetical protein
MRKGGRENKRDGARKFKRGVMGKVEREGGRKSE